MVRAIIPCAGYGTRVGMNPDESKEMLWDTEEKERLIDYSLNLCTDYGLEPLVILRDQKNDLKRHLTSRKVDFITIDPSKEWHASVLASKHSWAEDNILILPDTRFSPDSCISDIQLGLLMGNNVVLAVHHVNDPSNWGIVTAYTLFDKPRHLPGPRLAWGLIGFKKHYGDTLFDGNRLATGITLDRAGFTHLSVFQDVTRENSNRFVKL